MASCYLFQTIRLNSKHHEPHHCSLFGPLAEPFQGVKTALVGGYPQSQAQESAMARLESLTSIDALFDRFSFSSSHIHWSCWSALYFSQIWLGDSLSLKCTCWDQNIIVLCDVAAIGVEDPGRGGMPTDRLLSLQQIWPLREHASCPQIVEAICWH